MSPASAGTIGKRPFFGRVDALRGIGALTVAGYHFSGCPLHGVNLLQPSLWAAASPVQRAIGRLGVWLLPGHAFLMVFFVISGFVLRLSLEHGPQATAKAAARFVIARLFRFYPIVTMLMIVSAAMALMGIAYVGVSAREYAANLLLLSTSMNNHLWALQVELLMVPVIFALFLLERRWGAPWVAALAVTASGLTFVSRWAVWPPLSVNLFAIPLGMTIPTLGRRFATSLSRRAATWTLLGAAAVWLTVGQYVGFYSRITTVIEAYFGAVVLSLVAYRPDLPGLSWMDRSWLRRLGAAAGSYYVLHMATVPAALRLASWLIPEAWSAEAPGMVGVGVMAVWLAAIAPVMVGISRLVEEPGVSLGRRVIRALQLDTKRQIQVVSGNVVERRAA